jgi:hypothetical protein
MTAAQIRLLYLFPATSGAALSQRLIQAKRVKS